MRPLIIFILLLFSFGSIKAQSKEVSEKYELHIKDKKILDALSFCFSDFDNFIKNYKHYLFKVYLTYYNPDDLEMIIDYYTPNDTLHYAQPDHFFKYKDRIALVYNGENQLTKIEDQNFRQYILSVCREKMIPGNSRKPDFSRPIDTNNDINPSAPKTTPPTIIPKIMPGDTDKMELVEYVHVSPRFKYSIRKIKDIVKITGLEYSTF